MTEYLWIIFALLSAVAAAAVAIFGKLGLQGVDTNTATAIRAIIMAIFLMLVVIFQGKTSQIGTVLANHKALGYIVLSGVAGALSWLFYFIALKSAKVTQIVPIDRMSVIFAAILAFLILGEKVSFKGWAGAVLMIIGGILMAIK